MESRLSLLESLYPEILIYILAFSKPSDICNVGLTSKTMQKIVNTNYLWLEKYNRYFPYLAANNLLKSNDAYQASFQVILKTEFQDFSPEQFELLHALSNRMQDLIQHKDNIIKILLKPYYATSNKTATTKVFFGIAVRIARVHQDQAFLDYLYHLGVQTLLEIHKFNPGTPTDTIRDRVFCIKRLHLAIICNRPVSEIQRYVDDKLLEGSDTDYLQEYAPSIAAAEFGNVATLAFLLNRRPQLIESKDQAEQTPLLWAAAKGHLNCVETLLRLGADINVYTSVAQNVNRFTPLAWAVRNGHLAVVERLFAAGASLQITKSSLNSYHDVLEVALSYGEMAIFNYLLSTDACEHDLQHYCIRAIEENWTDSAKQLIQQLIAEKKDALPDLQQILKTATEENIVMVIYLLELDKRLIVENESLLCQMLINQVKKGASLHEKLLSMLLPKFSPTSQTLLLKCFAQYGATEAAKQLLCQYPDQPHEDIKNILTTAAINYRWDFVLELQRQGKPILQYCDVDLTFSFLVRPFAYISNPMLKPAYLKNFVARCELIYTLPLTSTTFGRQCISQLQKESNNDLTHIDQIYLSLLQTSIDATTQQQPDEYHVCIKKLKAMVYRFKHNNMTINADELVQTITHDAIYASLVPIVNKMLAAGIISKEKSLQDIFTSDVTNHLINDLEPQSLQALRSTNRFFQQHSILKTRLYNQKNIMRVFAADQHILFLTPTGRAFGLGNNAFNEMGLPENKYTKPTEIQLPSQLPITQIFTGQNNTIYLDSGHNAYIAGSIAYEQRGSNTDKKIGEFIEISLPNGAKVKDVVIGNSQFIIKDTQNQWWVRGDNHKGQLGKAVNQTYYTFVRMELPDRTPIKKVVTSSTTTCVQDCYDNWYACGDVSFLFESFNQTSDFIPIRLPNNKKVHDVVMGSHAAWIQAENGTWFGGGENTTNHFGLKAQPRYKQRLTPIKLPNNQQIIKIVPGDHTFYQAANGSWFVAGSNKFGQLGCGHNEIIHGFYELETPDKSPIMDVVVTNHQTLVCSQKNEWFFCGNNDKNLFKLSPHQKTMTLQPIKSVNELLEQEQRPIAGLGMNL